MHVCMSVYLAVDKFELCTHFLPNSDNQVLSYSNRDRQILVVRWMAQLSRHRRCLARMAGPLVAEDEFVPYLGRM
jgi:hypothetical protein